MAKITFSGLVTDIKGKIGGTVFSRNKGGAYIRNKVTPLNPQTSYQVGVRNFMASLSQAWRGLSAANRTAWELASKTDGKLIKDGATIVQSGFGYFMQLNRNLMEIDQAQIDAPPVLVAVESFTSMTLTSTFTGGIMTLAFAPAIAATEKVILYATSPYSAGISNVNNKFRKIAQLGVADLTGLSIASNYTAKFGALPLATQKVSIMAKHVVIATGQAGIPMRDDAVTGA